MSRLILAVAALLVSAAPAGAQPARLNVLFVMADDLRCDLGCYGAAARTPNLDALAARGVRFDRAYCQQAVCNPSRSSLLTGRRPDTLQLWSNGMHFRERNPDVLTLPQLFLRNGYEARCVGKVFHNWHTTQKGDRRSWSADEFLHYANHGDDAPQVRGVLPPNVAGAFPRQYGSVPLCERRDVPDEAYYDGRVAAEAVRVIGEVKDKLFFLAVGFWKPHAPFNAPKRYWDVYHSPEVPGYNPARPVGGPDVALHDGREILGIPPARFTPTAAQAAEMRHGYLANVSYLDAQVGKVLQALADNGLTGRTIVVFLSDHGYHLGEHSLWGKTSCYELDARVPLIVATPNMTSAGRTASGLVELVDLYPTLTGLTGLDAPQELDGTSFAPLLANPTRVGKAVAFTQHPRPAYYDRTAAGVPEAMGVSARTDHGRYTEWRDWTTGRVIASEWYDHSSDPHERVNRYEAVKDNREAAAVRRALHGRFPPNTPPAKR
ncbi:sulfatase [Urbifossiella limnaea]|uniref:Choline-sulfatase n=1 Tax=Urbifossiella limnaea TaxID=2528023 RepID=A0A517XUB8_9BACT|nr:sulfatase [Urbifossiella limnaea]QDU21076.1 Choline-sulfatase [Urbifossiella limnaea]